MNSHEIEDEDENENLSAFPFLYIQKYVLNHLKNSVFVP
jgi:hypothetical protein